MAVREKLKQHEWARRIYFWLRYLRHWSLSGLAKTNITLFHPTEAKLRQNLQREVRNTYATSLNLKNKKQFYDGKNILGYPALSYIAKDEKFIGWSEGKIEYQKAVLPLLQVETDINTNLPRLFEKYRPKYIVDFGTASGGSAVFFYNLSLAYTDPKILSIDVSNKDFISASQFHTLWRTRDKIEFLVKDSLACVDEVKYFINSRQAGEKVLLSFDDLHTYEHTYQELVNFAPLLKAGDVILMQDTWDQGLFGHETSPMLAVFRFLKENKQFILDKEYLKSVDLPCNFIHGVITRI